MEREREETHEVVLLRVVVDVVDDEVVGSTHWLVERVVGATQREVVVDGATHLDVLGWGLLLPEVQDA